MPLFPFRNPVSDNVAWKPPSYAGKPIEEWTPPSYAGEAIEEKKPNALSRVYEAVVHPKPLEHKVPKYEKTPSDIARDKMSIEELAADPLYGTSGEKLKGEPEKGFLFEASSAASKFLGEHPKVRDIGRRLLVGPSKEELGGKELLGPGQMKIPGVEEAGKYAERKLTGTGNYYLGALGGLVGYGSELASTGFDPRTAGTEPPKPREFPIRRGREEIPAVSEIPKETPKEIPKVEEAKKPFVSPFKKKPETVKLYRGESEESKAGPDAGRYFTDRPDVALYYSKRGGGKGRIYSAELPAEEASKYRDLTSAEEGTHLLPQELAEKARGNQLGLKKPEIIPEGEGIKSKSEYIDAGHKVPEVQDDGSIWIYNLHGKGTGGTATEKEVAIINNTNKMRRNVGKEAPPEFKIPSESPSVEEPKRIPISEWKRPDYFKPIEDVKTPELVLPPKPGRHGGPGPEGMKALNEFAYGPGGIESAKHPLDVQYTIEPLKTNASGESAASLEAINRQSSMKSAGEQYVVYNRSGRARPLIGPEAVDYAAKKGETYGIQESGGRFRTLEDKGGRVPLGEKNIEQQAPSKTEKASRFTAPAGIKEESITAKPESLAGRATIRLQESEDAAFERIKSRGTFKGGRVLSGLPVDDLADFAIIGSTKIAKGVVKFADWSAEMIKDFGEAIKPHLKKIFDAAQNKHTENSLKGLLNSLIESKGASAEQQELYKAERAARFSAFKSTSGEGVDWARKAMSTLKGEYEKVNPGEGLGLTQEESNTLLTAIKKSETTTPEKARGIEALFKLMNGEKTLQPNEIDLLDHIFERHLGKVSGPGASTPYDIKSGGKPINFSEAVSKRPDDFLTKLANFSSKSTRAVLGLHVPGTALSFHGFNEAIRNTVFGPNLNPLKAAERFGTAIYYLARPGKAQAYLDTNIAELGEAIREGKLRATTGDIGQNSLFSGDNFISKGFNALTNPRNLFEQVIPALKLKGYQGLLKQYEKFGMPRMEAARAAGEATNNIFGGLNLHELERSPNTQKLFRIAALAPDWLESNIRLGKGMLSSIKNPSSPQSKVYMTGMANFLGSYVALNVLNAINNNGRFSFQNEVGHEFDIAYGKDSSGKTRYFSPYGTAMDMVRIPLEIGHAAIEGNMGRAFSNMRSRASEPVQFLTDMMTNTDYAGRSLYNKTKYGKPIPLLEQAENILGAAAGHFLPVGIESGVNLAQGKVSPEQFAAQVLQLPMKYKTPERKQGKVSIGKVRLF